MLFSLLWFQVFIPLRGKGVFDAEIGNRKSVKDNTAVVDDADLLVGGSAGVIDQSVRGARESFLATPAASAIAAADVTMDSLLEEEDALPAAETGSHAGSRQLRQGWRTMIAILQTDLGEIA
jgi:hypothetical protein